MAVALYYHPEAYSIRGPKLMGRNAAGDSFLRGFFQHAKASEFWLQVETEAHARDFATRAIEHGRREPVQFVTRATLSAIGRAGTIYYPGPGIGEHAFHRAAHAQGNGGWSLCGITHTTSSAGAMDALAQIITAPVEPWDALICTSSAVKTNVEQVLQAEVDRLRHRLGITRLVLPQMPVIPLGIHTQDFERTDEARAAARTTLDLAENTLVVLFMGRLSFHAKAHPLAMYQALQLAAERAGCAVTLIECGWHANEAIRAAYEQAARLACPSVRVVTLDGRDAAAREQAFASADIFCSLSDNIQETFGITPIEAMAAGLPVVVSDWDGYKDTVRDGIDGFRVPTLMPQAGLATDLALRHALEIDTYDMYCGYNCSLVAVDVEATAKAFENLFLSPDLRRTMGDAGQARARALYDWSAIIPRYEALWAELDSRRLADSGKAIALTHPWPARMDPFAAFAAYPTQRLEPATRLCLVDDDPGKAKARLQAYSELSMVNFAKLVIPERHELDVVLRAASRGAQEALTLVEEIAPERRAFVFRSLAWLVKLHILRVCA